ncbi:MAG: hypothetical protein ACRD0P_37400 [Stackebrandtia sp.]
MTTEPASIRDQALGELLNIRGAPDGRFLLMRNPTAGNNGSIDVVAKGELWPGGLTIMQWVSSRTITIYTDFRQVEQLHHTARTRVAWTTLPPKKT